MVLNIIAIYCCTQKILKETEAEETIAFVATFLSLMAFQFVQ